MGVERFFYWPKPFRFAEVSKINGAIIYTRLIGWDTRRKFPGFKESKQKELKRLKAWGYECPMGEPKER